VLDPARFGGTDRFLAETGFLARAVRANPPRPGFDAARLPGDGAMARRARALAEGIALHPAIPPMLAKLAARHGLEPPSA